MVKLSQVRRMQLVKKGVNEMEVGSQIKKLRSALGLSQEELAEKIYVTRQTISNWENEKSYPDIHSLLALSSLFEISLDQLIKGDIEIMKQEIDKEKVGKFNRLAKLFAVLFIASIAVFVPLVVFLRFYGVIIWAILYLITLITAVLVEKLKKSNNIHTYKEIVAFSEGNTLSLIQKQGEIGKRPYQTALKFLVGGLIGAIIAAIAIIVLSNVK